jgi:hypothetical protein
MDELRHIIVRTGRSGPNIASNVGEIARESRDGVAREVEKVVYYTPRRSV